MMDAREERCARALEALRALAATIALMQTHRASCVFCGKTRAYGHCGACPLTRAQRQLAAIEQAMLEAF